MDFAIDRHYFHYTTREAAFDHILPTRKLRFSTYKKMRDPLERLEWEIGGAWFPDPDDPHAGERIFGRFAAAVEEIKGMARLLALTIDAPGATPDRYFSRGWARARMWEFYADAHRGVCLVFDRERLTARIVDSIQERCGVRPYYGKVDYTPSGVADLTVDVAATDIGTRAGAARYVEEHKDELFYLKATDWETEYEFRFVTTSEFEDDLFADYGDALVAVLVGEEFPDGERETASAAISRAGAEPMEVDWSMHRAIPIAMRIDRETDPFERRRTLLAGDGARSKGDGSA